MALTIAEGSGKRTKPDQIRFYSMALGALRECQCVLELEDIQHQELRGLEDQLGAILFKLSGLQRVSTSNCTPDSKPPNSKLPTD